MSKLLIANWKADPLQLNEAIALAKAEDAADVIVAPPFIFLSEVKKILKSARLGAQDIFWEGQGAFTGEVTPAMLANLNVHYAIIGHSERRRWLKETDEMINRKIKAALLFGLNPILCVGESLEVRKKGLAAAMKFVSNQLKRDLAGVTDVKGSFDLIVAYEPVWAIGTGTPENPGETAEAHKYIKDFLNSKFSARGGSAFGGKIQNSKILYGGSVNSQNAESFLGHEEIDGALVGGASVKADEFRKIIEIAGKY